MTLVPEGCFADIRHRPRSYADVMGHAKLWRKLGTGSGATPALALCAAALRARAASEETTHA
jgi:hypothetical protein